MNQYTKIILTVIAFLLCVVVGQNAFLERAEGQQGQTVRVFICGGERGVKDIEGHGGCPPVRLEHMEIRRDNGWGSAR